MSRILLVLVLLGAAVATYAEYQAGWVPLPDEGSSRTKAGMIVAFFLLNSLVAGIVAIVLYILADAVTGEREGD
jgi:hypothetical protein